MGKSNAKKLLESFGSIIQIGFQSDHILTSQVPSLNKSQLDRLKAGINLSRIIANEKISNSPNASSTKEIVGLLREQFRFSPVEKLYVLHLDSEDRPIDGYVHSTGTTMSTEFNYRSILQRAYFNNDVSGIIIAHNHPTGSAIPSKADIELTNKMMAACDAVDIMLHDHIIFGLPSRGQQENESDYCSMYMEGYIPEVFGD